MESLEEGTWHESHVVWHLPPRACVHVTHGTWRMKSKCEESEEVSSLWDQPKKRLWEKKNNSMEERKRKRKEKKVERRKERRKRKENEERKKKEGKGLRFLVFQRSEVVCPIIKVGLLDKTYE